LVNKEIKPQSWVNFREMGRPKSYRLALKSHSKLHFSKVKGGFFNIANMQNVIDSHQAPEYIPPTKSKRKDCQYAETLSR
jgi:hypothetical protein